MQSCTKRFIPRQIAASISPDVFIGTFVYTKLQSPAERSDNVFRVPPDNSENEIPRAFFH